MKRQHILGLLAPATFGSALIWASPAGRSGDDDENDPSRGLVQVPLRSETPSSWQTEVDLRLSEEPIESVAERIADANPATGKSARHPLVLPEPRFGRQYPTTPTHLPKVAAPEADPEVDTAAEAGLTERTAHVPVQHTTPSPLTLPPAGPDPLAAPVVALTLPPSALASTVSVAAVDDAGSDSQLAETPRSPAPEAGLGGANAIDLPVPAFGMLDTESSAGLASPAAGEPAVLARIDISRDDASPVADPIAGKAGLDSAPDDTPADGSGPLPALHGTPLRSRMIEGRAAPGPTPTEPPTPAENLAAIPASLAEVGAGPSGRIEHEVSTAEPDTEELAAKSNITLTPGKQVFPASIDGPEFTIDDELILQLKVRGIDATDTVIAYGTRNGVYLPLGELALILDLAIRVSDDGHYANGWFLSEDRTVTIDLRQGLLSTGGRTIELGTGQAQAFEGELYVRSDVLASIFPLDFEPDLRAQAVLLTTREPFPFEERMRREAQRTRLAQRGSRGGEKERWPREETPYLALSVPIADVELRAVSDSQRGTRTEADLLLAGDLAHMTAQAYLSATSKDGLVGSLLSLGRRDIDGELLGPLGATEFSLGDVATAPMPLGLRGASGRGAYVTNQPFQSFSIFDRVDLRGVLPDGYEVELYRNNVLLGSTAEAVNGQYEFLEIPVDYGLNVFRIVFYGPQGQKREEVRRISVGDGRLAPGDVEYSFGAVQNGTNLLGVTGPDFRPGVRFGDWQAVGEVAYGFSPKLTGVASAAFFQDEGRDRWLATAGLRTGLGGFALRADAGVSDGGGYAAGAGLGGAALGGAFTLSHFEYGGDFVDEVRSFTSQSLRRATELDFNTTIGLSSSSAGISLPLNLRARHFEFSDGRSQINAALRGSARLPGVIASNTFELSHSSNPGTGSFSQLAGDFNLATFNRSRTQLRGSVGYRVLPDFEVVQLSVDVHHAIDDRTVVSASSSYSLANGEYAVGASAIREFDRFTLAFDGQYSPQRGNYAVALRLGFSFGRDPLRERFFVTSPGKASSGAVALRAFHDRDADLVYGPGDVALPDVDFAAFNNVATTDKDGFARLGELGNGTPITVQVDLSTLPDISMAPASRGVEIVPRPGRFHVLQFPIFEVSEVEGTVSFVDGENERGVSGLRLRLHNDENGTEYWTRTERGGYFFYEQVLPGDYEIVIDPVQAGRLGICLDPHSPVKVTSQGSFIEQNLVVRVCEPAVREEIAAG